MVSNGNTSPKRHASCSPIKKRKVGKDSNVWLSSRTKILFFTLITALVAWLFSKYWPESLHYHGSNSQTSVPFESNSAQSQRPSESKNGINLPSGYTPSCSLKGKESISAINRASSDACKKQIAELACKSVDAPDGIGDLYPSQLPNFCPTA